MQTRGYLTLTAICLAILFAASASGIDVAVPDNMFTLNIEHTDTNNSGYYYFDLAAWKIDGSHRDNYLLTLNSSGDIVWFKQPDEGRIMSSWWPLEDQNLYMFSEGSLTERHKIVLLDSAYTAIDTIPNSHPGYENSALDAHEYIGIEDGSTWILWKRSIYDFDMSQYVPGGNTSMSLGVHMIEYRDPAGDIVWTWDSYQHLDELPPSARIDSSGLYANYVEQLHVNAFDFFPDGDLLVSPRHLSVIFRVDRETGDVLWRMGGGPLNDFTFINGTNDPDIPPDFNLQHDCRILENGNITVFDNGAHHSPPRSYAREYVIDEDAMTATLVWFYEPDDPFMALITGSHRKLDNGNRVIGWGGTGNELIGSEITEDGELVWQLSATSDAEHRPPFAYRVIKSDMFNQSAIPYLAEVYSDNVIKLFCNWFGHEDDVAGYDVYFGENQNDLPFYETTNTGILEITEFVQDQDYYCRIQAVNQSGEPISDYSELEQLHYSSTGVDELESDLPLPELSTLNPAWPNPFNTVTRVSLDLVKPMNVDLSVFDILGRNVVTLHDGYLRLGRHDFVLDGRTLSSGTYLVRMSNGYGVQQTRKITLVK